MIEWLLMILRVNLYLVGSSGCLWGHLIKGNETLQGFFSTDIYWAKHTFLHVSCMLDRNSAVHWESCQNTTKQKGPCARTHVREDMPLCQSDAILKVYLYTERGHRRWLKFWAIWIKIPEESRTVMLEKITQPLQLQGWVQKKKKKKMGTCWNRLIMSYSGHFFPPFFFAGQGVDCTLGWKGLIGNDNLLKEGVCQSASPSCLSASTATISTGRLADRSSCQRPQFSVVPA